MSLNLEFRGAFAAMSQKYRYLHTGGFSDKEMLAAKTEKARLVICEHRLSEAWYLFSLIEQKQRYLIDGPVSRGDTVEISLKFYHPRLKLEFCRR